MIVCKYKFDSNIYNNLIPEFNSGYNGYSINDTIDGNIITRTIECDTLPTLMRFGRAWASGESTTDNRTDSLLEVLDMNTSGLADCSSMFRYCTNLTSINCEWNTGNVTSMRYMFADCNNLTSLDVSNFNTSNVTDMYGMFWSCKSLTSLDVSNFNTSNVTNMEGMFQYCTNLTSLDVSNWNTGNVTTMGYMFHSCHNLTSLDVSNFITNNVTDMQSMFSKCSNLTTLDVSNFITSNVTNMHCMFRECQKLASLNVSNWNTSKVTDMGYIIYHCRSLRVLSLSSWNFDSVTDTTEMFYNCVSLVTLDTPRIKVPIYGNNFFGELCPVKYIRVNNLDVINTIEPQLKYARTSDNPGYIITSIDVSSIPADTISALSVKNWSIVSSSTLSKVAEYVYDSNIWRSLIPEFNSEFIDWFIDDVEDENGLVTRTISSIGGLPTLMRFGRVSVNGESTTDNRTDSLLEILDMNTSELTSCNSMFRYNTNLTSITCNWNTSNVTTMHSMFNNCTNLTQLDLSNFDTSNVTNMYCMFSYCIKLTSLDVSKWNTGNVTDMYAMFYYCQSLTSLDVSKWNTGKVTDMYAMFYYCQSLTSLDASKWNTGKVSNMRSMFQNCFNLASLDVSNFDTANVTNMGLVFYNCNKLTSLDVSNFNTANVTDMYGTFNGCTNLTSLDVSNFDTRNVTNMQGMFNNCTKLTQLDVSNFDTSKVTNMEYMFDNASKLVNIGMLYCSPSTINTISSNLSNPTTVWINGNIIKSELTSYDNITYEMYCYEKELLLNSPLLEGDKIVKKDGKIYHYHKMGKVVLDGSENVWGNSYDTSSSKFICRISTDKINNMRNYQHVFCDKFSSPLVSWDSNITSMFANDSNQLGLVWYTSISSVGAMKQWLQANPTTVVYELANPYYELISEDKDLSLTLPSTDNILTNNSLIPTNMNVKNSSMSTVGISNSSTYTVVFDKDTDNNIVVNLNGTSIETSDNRVEITTSNELRENELTFIGEGEISNVRILDGSVSGDNIPRESFEGLKSSFEDGWIPSEDLILDSEFYGNQNVHVIQDGDYATVTSADGSVEGNIVVRIPIICKANTLYTLVSLDGMKGYIIRDGTNKQNLQQAGPSDTVIYSTIFQTKQELDFIDFYYHKIKVNDTVKVLNNFMILEGDWTHLSSEDFEHLGQYKVEYKVTGKNKFDSTNNLKQGHTRFAEGGRFEQLTNNTQVNRCSVVSPIAIKPNTEYVVSWDSSLIVVGVQLYLDGIAVWDSAWKIVSPFRFNSADCNQVVLTMYNRVTGTDGTLTPSEVIKGNILLEEGITPTEYEPHKSYTKTFYLNSPLLEGDTIEDVKGVATHVKRYEKVVLDGNENWKLTIKGNNEAYYFAPEKIGKIFNDISLVNPVYSDRLVTRSDNPSTSNLFYNSIYAAYDGNICIVYNNLGINGIKQWLSENPVTAVYELAEPIYEPISTESVLCDSYVNGHLDFDSVVPVEKVEFKHINYQNYLLNCQHAHPNTTYTIQFESDNVGKLDMIHFAGTYLYNLNVVKGINRYSITTPNQVNSAYFTLRGIGFNVSNVQVVVTDRDNIKYFKGMESSFEDNIILSKNLFNKDKIVLDYGLTELGVISYDFHSSEYIECKPNTPYMCNLGIGIHYFDANKIWISYLNHGVPSPSNAKYLMKCLSKTADLNTVQIEEGTVVTSYTSYGEKYKVEASMVGKNKWKYGDILNKDVYQVYLDEPLKKGNYVISSTCGQKYEFNPYITFLNDEETIVGVSLVKDGRLVNISKDINRIVIYSNGYDYAASSGKPMDFTDIQLEEGTTKTEYKPYKETRETIYLNSPLLKGDRIEMYNGKLCHYHKMGKVVLDGSENWESLNDSEGIIRFYFKDPGNPSNIKQKCFSDRFPYSPLSTSEHEYIYKDSNLIIGIHSSKLTIISIDGFKQWLQANPTTVVYELVEPYYEEITPEHNEFTIVSIGESSFTIDSGNVPTDSEVTYNVNVKLLNDLEENMNSNTSSTNVDLTTILDDIINE